MELTTEQIDRVAAALVALLIEDIREETRKEAIKTDELITQHEDLKVLL